MGGKGFQTEHLDPRTRGLMKLQTGLYHARIIIYKECSGSNVVTYVVKTVFAHLPVTIDQQLAVIPFRQGVFGDPLVRKRIIEIGYIEGFIYHFFI
jgi:hypothetical protein